MKNKMLFLVMFVVSSVFLLAQENLLDRPFYYYKGEKFYLEVDYSRITVISEGKFDANIESKVEFNIENEDTSYTKQIIVLLDKNIEKEHSAEIFITGIKFQKELEQSSYENIISQFSKAHNTIRVMSAYTVSGQQLGISNNFYVKLFKKEDQNKLFDLAKKYSIKVLGYNEFMPLWFTLSCNKESQFNAIESANLFHETGLFESSEPELLYHDLLASNDQYFSNQWGLENTGQYSGTTEVDINVSQAWNITTGSPNIRVAVFDQGIQTYHPDLTNNIHGRGYDAQTDKTPANLRGIHGTPCAGIVAAQHNNTAGISGVAPNSKLVPISLELDWNNTPQQISNGFSWAWHNGMDVISCSWGGYAQSNFIDDAIANAQAQGRSGRGCVIVFSVGNENASSPRYPSTLPNVIAVGAISPCGERKSPSSCDGETTWGSNYGTELDVVAPGVLISTIDILGLGGYNPYKPIHTSNGGSKITADYANQDYTVWFNGTSAACPHVAAVAALILSVNPDLTAKQVRDIIEQTAQKVGGYTYANFAAHPNGHWHEQMGYGLVNAYEAVKRAACMANPVNYISLTGTQPPPAQQPYKQVICNEINIQNATVPAGSTLILDACNKTTINPNFKVEAGASFTIR